MPPDIPKPKIKAIAGIVPLLVFLHRKNDQIEGMTKPKKLAIKQSKCIPILRMKNDIGIPPYFFHLLYHISTRDTSFVKYLNKSQNEIRIYTIQNKNQLS